MTVGGERFFYVRPVNGDDSNDGLSFNTAWKTWQKAMELTTTAGTTSAAGLFLVNEGSAYTGPWADGSVQMNEIFNSDSASFKICGLSADGNLYPDSYFEFDLSGYTYSRWLTLFGNDTGAILFENIKWSGADSSNMDTLIECSYHTALGQSEFVNCIFEDNDFLQGIFSWRAWGIQPEFRKCVFRRNNSYSSSSCLFQNGSATSRNNNGLLFDSCIIEENQTKIGSSNYVLICHSLGFQLSDCAFYNNGKDVSSICVYLGSYANDARDRIGNNIFFNNAGTAIYSRGSVNSTAPYNYSVYDQHVQGNVFVLNNKSIDFQYEPGVRRTTFSNNVFYNNTVEDIPSYIKSMPGNTASNYVFDPEFTNGYSGDFSVPHDSRLFSYSTVPGVPIGGAFVQKKLFTTTDSGTFALGTGGVGDTVTVSGRSYQKIDDSPIVWRTV